MPGTCEDVAGQTGVLGSHGTMGWAMSQGSRSRIPTVPLPTATGLCKGKYTSCLLAVGKATAVKSYPRTKSQCNENNHPRKAREAERAGLVSAHHPMPGGHRVCSTTGRRHGQGTANNHAPTKGTVPHACPDGNPGVHQEECGQQVDGGSPPPLLCPSEAPSGVLCPVLGSPVQERWGATGESPAEGYKDGEGTGASLLRWKAEGAGFV